MDKTCKTCNYRSRCGGFRDREGRCPEGMAGDSRRWQMPRIDPHASALKQDKQLREQMKWLKKHGFQSYHEAQKEGY